MQLVKRQYVVALVPSVNFMVATIAIGDLGATEALRRLFRCKQSLHVRIFQVPIVLSKKAAAAGYAPGPGRTSCRATPHRRACECWVGRVYMSERVEHGMADPRSSKVAPSPASDDAMGAAERFCFRRSNVF